MYISISSSRGTAPLDNGNVMVSIDQIIMKLDIASEENMKLRNALHANNQLLDQKLQQFEPLIRENKSEKFCWVSINLVPFNLL